MELRLMFPFLGLCTHTFWVTSRVLMSAGRYRGLQPQQHCTVRPRDTPNSDGIFFHLRLVGAATSHADLMISKYHSCNAGCRFCQISCGGRTISALRFGTNSSLSARVPVLTPNKGLPHAPGPGACISFMIVIETYGKQGFA